MGVNIMDLKSILKKLKLNESKISMMLGGLVIIITAFLVVNYFKGQGNKGLLPFLSTGNKIEVSETTLPKSHKVEKGESLWKIAEKYYGSGYNWIDIAKENKIANSNRVVVGQELVLPSVEPKQLTQATVEAAVKTENAITGATYEVAKGDNLWKIAIRAYGDGYKWVEIARENKLINPNIIHSGNILVLPR
jgi:nucleoid-associated protein YgaU